MIAGRPAGRVTADMSVPRQPRPPVAAARTTV